MEEATLGVVVERIENLKNIGEQRHLDLKTDIAEVKKDTSYTNGRVTALEGAIVEDKIYKGQVKVVLYIFGVLFTLIIAPAIVIFIQSKLH